MSFYKIQIQLVVILKSEWFHLLFYYYFYNYISIWWNHYWRIITLAMLIKLHKIWSSTYTTLVLSASSCNMQVICWIFASLKHNTLMNVAFCKQLWLLFPRFLVHIRGRDHTSAAKWNHKLAFTWLSTLEIRKARDIKCDYVLRLQFQYFQQRSRIKFMAACVPSVL